MAIPAVSSFFLPQSFSANPNSQPFAIAGGNQRFSTPMVANQGLLMPKVHNQDLLMLMVERFMRADAALTTWATDAKRCIDFLEGKQWSAEELASAEADGRPTLTLNKLAPLVRLALGYHRQNRTNTKYVPTDDGASSEIIAQTMTKVLMLISKMSEEEYIDAEVFLDGIATGRGYYDWRLSFEKNDFGDMFCRAKDPFTIRPDADADTYDPDDQFGIGWGHVFESRWASIDEIEFNYGQSVSNLIQPLIRSSGYRGGIPSDMLDSLSEIAPWRTFGGQQNSPWMSNAWSVESYISNAIDPYRKNVRLIECQHKIRVMQRNIVDLDTGDREPIPTNFTPDQVQKIMMWAAEQYGMRGKQSPLRVEWRPTKRVRWTTMIADIIVYDAWSPYESYTIVPYFPYFRRGQSRGMIHDLIDPQREINKRRSSEIDILERVAHSGWMWHKDGLDEAEKEKIEAHGGAAGINIEYKGDPQMKPERIEPGKMPSAIKDLEQSATLDLKEIAGINDSALGQVDRVQSGRAIEARQRQSVLGLEMYMDNTRRTKRMNGRKKAELLQNHYTEPRMYRMQGNGSSYEMLGINQRLATGEILNNVTLGRYSVEIDESPLSATWLNAQFEEIMTLVEKGVLPIPMVQDIIVDVSSLPQKELIKLRLDAYLRAQGLMTGDDLAKAAAAGVPIDASQIPPPAAPGGAPGGAAAAPGEGPPVAGAGGPPGGAPNVPQQNSAAQGAAAQV